MHYDRPNTSDEVLAALRADRTISANTRDAIASILELDTDDSIIVGRWNGTDDDFEAPDGLVPDLLVVNSEEGGELDVPSYAENNSKAFIFRSNEDIEVTFDSPFTDPERVIVMGNGDDEVTVNDDANTTVDGGLGDDTIVTSSGDDWVVGGAGDDSVSTGEGDDTVVAGNGADTVDGGEGYDVVRLLGTRDDYSIDIVDGQLVITSNWDASNSVTAENVQLVKLSTGTIAVASSEEEATALRLYQGILDQDVDGDTARVWLEAIENGDATVEDMAAAFLEDCDSGITGKTSDAQFLDILFDNAMGRDATEAELQRWGNELDNGASRAEVAVRIVGTTEAADNIDGVQLIEGQV